MQYSSKFLSALLLVIITLISSCKKDSTDTTTPPGPTPTAINADVYVVGYEQNGAIAVAKLWKNGVATDISDGTKTAGATGIYVNGNDVYVCFIEGTRRRAKLWKNGVVNTLYFPDMNDIFVESAARGMCKGVVTGYIQVASTGRTVAVYWDDNGVHQLSNPATEDAEAISIHIKTINNFTRTSVCGQINSFTAASTRAFLWGGQFSNPSFNIIGNTQVTSVSNTCFINDNGFTYVGGRYTVPTIWFENGATMNLSDKQGIVNGLYVTGYSNMYAVGEELINGKTVARLWSGDYNAGPLQGTSLGNGQYQSSASAIQVVDGNTFVSGYEYDANGKTYAKYWKNGTPVVVGGPNSYAMGLFVVKK